LNELLEESVLEITTFVMSATPPESFAPRKVRAFTVLVAEGNVKGVELDEEKTVNENVVVPDTLLSCWTDRPNSVTGLEKLIVTAPPELLVFGFRFQSRCVPLG
jgi:hypothetical protein